jgi:hypothetical protein
MKQTLDAVDPQAKLLWPDLDSPAWIHAFVSKWGAAPFIDGVAPHPYSLHGQLPETQEYVRGAKDYLAMLDSHHIPRNVWITELGYTTHNNPAYRKGMVAYQPLTEPQQAAWLVRAYLSHLGWGVSRVFWYDLMEDGNDEKECEHRFGLLRHGSLSPKPAAVAYANLIRETRNCAWIAPCKLAGITRACAFAFGSADAGTCVVAAWAPEGSSDIRLPSSAHVMDIFGTALPLRDEMLTLTESPVYIHGLAAEDLDLGERVNLAAASPYVDPTQLDCPWPKMSHYKQPWRGYLETRSGYEFLGGLGVNLHIPPAPKTWPSGCWPKPGSRPFASKSAGAR